MKIIALEKPGKKAALIYTLNSIEGIKKLPLTKAELAFVSRKLEKGKIAVINNLGAIKTVCLVPSKNDTPSIERSREHGARLCDILNKNKIESAALVNGPKLHVLAIAEGLALANYQFLKYFKDKSKRKNSLQTIEFVGKTYAKNALGLTNIVQAVYASRTLVNEPLSYLTAEMFAKNMQSLGNDAGIKVEVFNQTKIETLKMGGLLAVNKGSLDPATFTVMEWKPKNAKNKKPLVLVGKGIVYDTGGLSLKPTANSMDIMKCDMGGGAAVVGGIVAIAKNKLPIHVVALIPATDNRPGGNAYAPGDVVTMYDGTTVEVLNTDAEGRMVLADALAYAKKYKPELVIDAATLTGAAARAIGPEGVVAMGNAKSVWMNKMKAAGDKCYERIVEFPFWDEYGEQVKSKIADLKNLGGPSAGAITAGKFLENFTDYPYIHLDIAGPAWLDAKSHYRTQGGSGVGVRLFYEFALNYSK